MDETDTSGISPQLVALQRWLVQLRDPKDVAYSYIRRIELGFDATRDDTKRLLRGVQVGGNLVITRQLIFFQLIGRRKARAISLEDVAQKYSLEEMQTRYRTAMEAWKASQRTRAS